MFNACSEVSSFETNETKSKISFGGCDVVWSKFIFKEVLDNLQMLNSFMIIILIYRWIHQILHILHVFVDYKVFPNRSNFLKNKPWLKEVDLLFWKALPYSSMNCIDKYFQVRAPSILRIYLLKVLFLLSIGFQVWFKLRIIYRKFCEDKLDINQFLS